MILIRAYFEWYKVDEKTAYKFCLDFMSRLQNIPENERVEVINKKHLKGITFEELERRNGDGKENSI